MYLQLLQKVYPNCRIVDQWELKGGISAQMTAFTVEALDGNKHNYVVRKLPSAILKKEKLLLEYLHSVGVSVPSVCLLTDEHLVMEYVEGNAVYAKEHSTGLVKQMAEELAKIHQLSLPSEVAHKLPKQKSRLEKLLSTRPAKLDETIDEERIRDIVEAAWPFKESAHSCLIHGDFWPGNLLFHNGLLVAITDWEDGELGSPLYDFAVSQLDVLWVFGKEAMDEFSEHYRSLTKLDFAPLPYWQLLVSLRPRFRFGQWASAYPHLGRADITESTLRAGHNEYVKNALSSLK